MIEFFVELMLCDTRNNCEVFARDMQRHVSLEECLEENNAALSRWLSRGQLTEDDRRYIATCVENGYEGNR